MKGFLSKVQGLSRFLNVIAGISLTFLMFLTVMDVILRTLKRPIVGTYELVAFSGAVVIGFALPLTSWMRGHIYVDFFTQKFQKPVRNIFNIATRCSGDCPILSDRLESHEIWDGSSEIRRSLSHPADAFLSGGIWRWRLLFRSVSGHDLRYFENRRRGI